MSVATQKEIVEAVASALAAKNLSQQAVAVVQRSTEKVLKRLQQDVSEKVKEDGDEVVEGFCRNLATKLGNLSQNWHDGISNDLVVYPEGTRFIYRDGANTVIVIEQSPQVRTVNLSRVMQHLAFPYVVFTFCFVGGKWDGGCQVALRQKPLVSLDDRLLQLVLPNVVAYNVCLGSLSMKPNHNMTEQANAVIASFWQSQFGGMEVSAWAKKSKDDPLFVLHEKYSELGTLRELVNSLMKAQSVKVDIVKTLKAEIVTAVGAIGAEIQKTMLNLDMVKQNKEKVHIETLDEILKEIIVQSYAELWEFLQAQLQKERAKMQQEMLAVLKKKNLGTVTEFSW